MNISIVIIILIIISTTIFVIISIITEEVTRGHGGVGRAGPAQARKRANQKLEAKETA